MTASETVVLITGATSGIGQATAELLAAKGYRVFGTSRHPEGKTATGYELLPLEVSSDESAAACVAAVAERTGGTDRRADEQRRHRHPRGRRGDSTGPGSEAVPG